MDGILFTKNNIKGHFLTTLIVIFKRYTKLYYILSYIHNTLVYSMPLSETTLKFYINFSLFQNNSYPILIPEKLINSYYKETSPKEMHVNEE